MSKREKLRTFFVVGFVVFLTGWAIRSTFIMHNYENKPLGGGLIAIGMFAMGVSAFKLLKK